MQSNPPPNRSASAQAGATEIPAVPQRLPSFRYAVTRPASEYFQVNDADDSSLDARLTKTLLDMKLGRHRQSLKRYHAILADLGFSATHQLLDYSERLNADTAALVIFDLLFKLTSNDTLEDEQIWQYVETLSIFDPDDLLCSGIVYNLLLVHSMRQVKLGVAEEFANLALAAFEACESTYLQAFIHLHLAFIHVYGARLEQASDAIQNARTLFENSGAPGCELAMVETTRLWILAEQHNQLPDPDMLEPLRQELSQGEFWPETFLVLAALHLRCGQAQDDHRMLERFGAFETTLRVRGMTEVLPAMQLMREEITFNSRSRNSVQGNPINLPERELILLLPTTATLALNWGPENMPPPQTDRIRATQALVSAVAADASGGFDAATPHYWEAIESIADQGWIYLLQSERGHIDNFIDQCRKRKRFVEKARHVQHTILAQQTFNTPTKSRPPELTESEFGILRRLSASTGNKALARDLGVAETTVKFHLRNIYRKLGVGHRREAIKAAAGKGWITFELQSGE